MIIKKSEKDERREKIIDVAFRLFVNKKIESVTMEEQHCFAISQEN